MYTLPREDEIVDSKLAERMADEAVVRPDVRRWIRRLKRLIRDTPKGVQIFVNESVMVLALGPNGERFVDEEHFVDAAAAIDSVGSTFWGGGS